VFPIIQSRPFYPGIIYFKSEGLDEMQGGSGRQTDSANIAGVHWDFRLDKYNIKSHGTVSIE
jgi:hypothetical protein